MHASFEKKQKQIIAEFDRLPDIDAKYAYLFQIGEALPKMNNALKDEDHLVKGCQSKLWFHLSHRDGCLHLEADSDSMVIKGIAALLVKVIEECHPADILHLSMDFIDKLNIWKLASERNNGLVTMLNHIKQEAAELQKPLSVRNPGGSEKCQT